MKKIFLRFAKKTDSEEIFRWRNDPVTVKYSPSGRVRYEEHLQWYSRKLVDRKTYFLIATNFFRQKIGIVRFDKYGNDAEISINLNPKFRGKGNGSKILEKSINFYFNNTGVKIIKAKIDPSNTISLRLFRKKGFVSSSEKLAEKLVVLKISKDDWKK